MGFAPKQSANVDVAEAEESVDEELALEGVNNENEE